MPKGEGRSHKGSSSRNEGLANSGLSEKKIEALEKTYINRAQKAGEKMLERLQEAYEEQLSLRSVPNRQSCDEIIASCRKYNCRTTTGNSLADEVEEMKNKVKAQYDTITKAKSDAKQAERKAKGNGKERDDSYHASQAAGSGNSSAQPQPQPVNTQYDNAINLFNAVARAYNQGHRLPGVDNATVLSTAQYFTANGIVSQNNEDLGQILWSRWTYINQ